MSLAAAAPAGAATHSNTTPIAVAGGGAFLPYPSVINVGGEQGTVTKVRATVNRIAQDGLQTVYLVLAGPGGQHMELLSYRCSNGGVGQNTVASPITFTFDDAAPTRVSEGPPCASGTFQPSAGDPATSLPAPAPGAPYTSSLSVFNGTVPNGLWQLYAFATLGGTGSILGGWSLELTTTGAPPTPPPTSTSRKCKKKKKKRAQLAKKKKCKKKRK